MATLQCEKCGEVVAEAKAFCPGCGNALLVEQTRETPSSFEAMDHTVQLGQTMYHQMLSDMGLDTSRRDRADSKPEVTPLTVAEKKIDVIRPAVASVPDGKRVTKSVDSAIRSDKKRWLIAGGVFAAVILFLIVAAVVAAFWILPQLRN
ncbi:MAG: hypothetical protein WKF34_07510 [Pyrinomonadaceae bacterium]